MALSACGPGARSAPGTPDPTGAPATRPPANASGYLAPPSLTAARRTAAGLVLQGEAPAGAQVNLASPEGVRFSVKTGPDGHWSVSLPGAAGPDMFALSAELAKRIIRAEGAVLTLPEPGPPALMVQAGFAAAPLGAAPTAPVITALDYDRGGSAAVAGMIRPMARVRLSIDGVAAGLGQADELGRFSVLAANRPLTPGRRQLRIDSDVGRAQASVDVSQSAPLGALVYRAARQDGAWRIDWTPAGGGVQTSVVFDRTTATGPAS